MNNIIMGTKITVAYIAAVIEKSHNFTHISNPIWKKITAPITDSSLNTG